MNNLQSYPYSQTVEKSVLSSILQFPQMLWDAPILTSEHFHSPGLSEMFSRMSAIIKESKGETEIDNSTLFDSLARSGTLERMGGPVALVDISTHSPSPAHFSRHVQTLNEFLARRMAIKTATAILESASGDEDVSELVAAISQPITAIHDTLASAKPATSTKGQVIASLNRYEARVRGEATPMGIPTGIHDIDYHLKGLKPGRMWVIGAYPSGGKSAIGGQICTNVALSGIPALFLTLEMPESDIIDRCIIQASKCPALAFTDPAEHNRAHGATGPTTANLESIKGAALNLARSPLIVDQPANRKLTCVLAAIRRAHRTHGIKIAAVDFVQRIHGTPTKNHEQEVAEISHAVTETAMELGIHILMLSQLNADGDTKHGRVIEEDADAFLQIVQEMVKDKPNYKEHQHVLIAKDRHHSQGGIRLPLILDKQSIRFVRGFPESSSQKKNQPGF
jgi:replicative DNA helicase